MDQSPQFPYINRELSWIDFNARVLEKAVSRDTPVMERLRFLAITGSNLDEFIMVRVAGVKQQIESGYHQPDPSGLTPDQLMAQLDGKIAGFVEKQYSCLHRSILPALRKLGITFVQAKDLTGEQREYMAGYFERTLFPVLTPLAVDRSRPFPFLSNKSLNLAVRLRGGEGQESYFAVVQAPGIVSRFMRVPGPGDCYVLLEDVIISQLGELFEKADIQSACPFRITRNGDLDIDEEAEDLMEAVEQSIQQRKRGRPVRLELTQRADRETKEFLMEMLDVAPEEVYEVTGPLDLTFFSKFAGLPQYAAHCYEPIQPVNPPAAFWGCDDLFAAIQEGDKLVHHPYESFDCVVEFVRQAAEDQRVLAIKQTLYRVSGHSPIVAALIRAAENGKQVTVLVELKARFDEENNINWARKLEEAGCHVIYGLSGLKTHCKILLVVRQDEDGIRRYVHMGTGNYNDATAKIYTDLGLFTCKEPYGRDASSLFNVLTGYSRPPEYNRFVVAPHGMRRFFTRMIEREIANAQAGLPSGVTAKVNSLVDPEIIALLYRASQAGVPVHLIVRGICCLAPGLPGLSETITVRSLVGQLLEHSRVFCFANAGDPRVYLGSADWMPRNLDRRVELVFPVEDGELRRRVLELLDLTLADNQNARVLGADMAYRRIDMRGKSPCNSQRAFFEMAQQAVRELGEQEAQKPLKPLSRENFMKRREQYPEDRDQWTGKNRH